MGYKFIEREPVEPMCGTLCATNSQPGTWPSVHFGLQIHDVNNAFSVIRYNLYREFVAQNRRWVIFHQKRKYGGLMS